MRRLKVGKDGHTLVTDENIQLCDMCQRKIKGEVIWFCNNKKIVMCKECTAEPTKHCCEQRNSNPEHFNWCIKEVEQE